MEITLRYLLIASLDFYEMFVSYSILFSVRLLIFVFILHCRTKSYIGHNSTPNFSDCGWKYVKICLMTELLLVENVL